MVLKMNFSGHEEEESLLMQSLYFNNLFNLAVHSICARGEQIYSLSNTVFFRQLFQSFSTSAVNSLRLTLVFKSGLLSQSFITL